MALPIRPPAREPRAGLGRASAVLIVAFALCMHAPDLRGPWADGQAGNCGAMFSIFARNEQALGGLLATRGVPIANPVPPAADEIAERYTHHPPGLPWAVMLAARLPVEVETAGRLVAWLATLATALLLADLAVRCGNRPAGLAAGLFALGLPAGWRYGLLVNYETVALPALLLLARSLVFRTRGAFFAGAAAALVDWIALLPLVLSGLRRDASWRRAGLGAAVVMLAWLLLARQVAPGSWTETLAQALATTPFARDFDLAAWWRAQMNHAGALYGWSLVFVPLPWLRTGALSPTARRLLTWLGVAGVFNVVVFARHASGHEHYALLLLPFVALSLALLLFPTASSRAARPAVAVGAVVLTALIAGAAWQTRASGSGAPRYSQSEFGRRLAVHADPQAVHVRPAGASFVALHAARRHLVPSGVDSPLAALESASAWATRFGLGRRPVVLVLASDEPVPAWLPGDASATERDGLRFYPLGETTPLTR